MPANVSQNLFRVRLPQELPFRSTLLSHCKNHPPGQNTVATVALEHTNYSNHEWDNFSSYARVKTLRQLIHILFKQKLVGSPNRGNFAWPGSQPRVPLQRWEDSYTTYTTGATSLVVCEPIFTPLHHIIFNETVCFYSTVLQ